jgi:hypothetical protein
VALAKTFGSVLRKISVFAPKARFRRKANAPFARSANFLEKVAEGDAGVGRSWLVDSG